MGGEDHGSPLGNVELVLDEDRAASLEVADDVRVVDDLLANVNRRPVEVEELLDGVDGSFHAGAIATGRREKDSLNHAASVEAQKWKSPPLGGSVRRASQIAHRGLRGQVRTAAVCIAQCQESNSARLRCE